MNAVIRVNYVPKEITIKDIRIEHFAHGIGAKFVNTDIEDDYWQTSLFVGSQRRTQILMLHRMAVYKGVAFELLFIFPNYPSENESNESLKALMIESENANPVEHKAIGVNGDQIQPFIDIFLNVCKSMKILNIQKDCNNLKIADLPNAADVYRDKTLKDY